MANAGEIISKVAAFGVGGWLAENAICGTARYSSLFGNTQIPFLPIYAVNGLVLTTAAKYVPDRWPWLARGIVYAALGSGVEWAGCQIDRQLLNNSPQMYGSSPDALTNLTSGCVNFKRSALWGGMGLFAEKIA